MDAWVPILHTIRFLFVNLLSILSKFDLLFVNLVPILPNLESYLLF